MISDGYKTREYWSEEGWEWVQFKQAKHPLFWVCPLNCKSGCGGEISSYSHCQSQFLNDEQIEFFNDFSDGSDQSIKQKKFQHEFLKLKLIDENENEKTELFPYKFLFI